MGFKLLCPKCESTDYAVERDRRIRTLSDPAAGLIFSCRCGKQLFGTQVEEEYKRQYKAWETSQSSRRPAAGVPASQASQSTRPSAVAAQHGQALDVSSANLESAHHHDGGSVCTWAPCEKIARPGSKYCSRACSNKNARARYKQRKNGSREAREAA